MNTYSTRPARLMLGFLFCSTGIHLTIQANIGQSPWEAFTIGLTYQTGLSFGVLTITIGILILAIDHVCGEKIGFGTILNTVLVGFFVDLILAFDPIQRLDNFYVGVVMLSIGQTVICLGTYYYIGSALGCGPRDALMVAAGKRLPTVPIGLVRGVIEGTVLLLGWLLGAKMGIGTVIAVFGIGFILQATFKTLRFDVKGFRHESIAETLDRFRRTAAPDEPQRATVRAARPSPETAEE